MKKVRKISLFFIYSMLLLLTGAFGFQELEHFFYPGRSQETQESGNSESDDRNAKELSSEEKGQIQNGEAASVENADFQSKEENLQTVSSRKNTLNCDTDFKVISIDLQNQTQTEETQDLPEKYFGMDMEQFLDAMEEYEISPPLADLNKGFESLEVTKFSPEQVIIKKVYNKKEIPSDFYLAVMDHYVVVLENDRQTIFMETGIPVSSLPEETAREVMRMKYVKSEEELYNFLESYSS